MCVSHACFSLSDPIAGSTRNLFSWNLLAEHVMMQYLPSVPWLISSSLALLAFCSMADFCLSGITCNSHFTVLILFMTWDDELMMGRIWMVLILSLFKELWLLHKMLQSGCLLSAGCTIYHCTGKARGRSKRLIITTNDQINTETWWCVVQVVGSFYD